MSKEQQPTDYFFVVQTDRPSHIGDKDYIFSDHTIFCKGTGLEVVAALARVAVLDTAQRDDSLLGRHFDHERTMGLASALPAFRGGYGYGMVHRYDGSVRADGYGLDRFFDYKFLHKQQEKHCELVYNQVRDGYRSPADALEEMITAENDLTIIMNNQHSWYDDNGRRLLPLSQRKGATPTEKERAQLDLKRTIRRAATYFIHPATRTALFQKVPDNAKAYGVDVLPLRKESWGTINPDRLFYGGQMLVHRTFGYVPKGSEEFVPVVSELAADHPVRQLMQATPRLNPLA